MYQYSTTGLKSPCVKDCPDRVAGCVKTCQKLKDYEAAKFAAYDKKSKEIDIEKALEQMERKRGNDTL